jgi:hypothetical protein
MKFLRYLKEESGAQEGASRMPLPAARRTRRARGDFAIAAFATAQIADRAASTTAARIQSNENPAPAQLTV